MYRLALIVAALAVELIALSVSVDGYSLRASPSSIGHLFGAWAEPSIHALVTLAVLTATFTWLKRRPALNSFRQDLAYSDFRPWTLAVHLAFLGALLAAAHWLHVQSAAQGLVFVLAFLLLSAGLFLSGLAIVQPLALWGRSAKSIGEVWLWAGLPALMVAPMTAGWQAMWQPAAAATYGLVQLMLRPLVGTLASDPSRLIVGTTRFSVTIAPGCSGLEGMGLLLLFGLVWFWLYRNEYRFPQAFLLLPLGLLALFVLNAARIAALLLIGHAGAQKVALEGFHSQAGWMAFNGVALGFCFVADRIPWIATPETRRLPRPAEATRVNIVAVCLGPFLAILAAGMVSAAMKGGFEWAYPLRLLGAAAVVWIYRGQYRQMDWRFTWSGAVFGLLAFAVWVGLEWAVAGSPAGPVPAALQAAPGSLRWSWTGTRVLGAVAAVPFAEELAFRGYLMRRLVTEDFDRLSPRFTFWSLAISSAAFGAMHGARWLAGAVAGLIYGMAYIRKGRLADAVIAHAVTNGLIAAAVLGLGYWKLW